jgi:hypothetical protein
MRTGAMFIFGDGKQGWLDDSLWGLGRGLAAFRLLVAVLT